VILTEADFTTETGVLAVTVARQALKILSLDHLAAGLVLELVILTQELKAEAARESPTSIIPDASLTLDAFCVSQGAVAGMGL